MVLQHSLVEKFLRWNVITLFYSMLFPTELCCNTISCFTNFVAWIPTSFIIFNKQFFIIFIYFLFFCYSIQLYTCDCSIRVTAD